MYLVDISPKPYKDPWILSFKERLQILSKGQQRVAYFYESPDSSTFRYRVYNMLQALEKCPNISASYFTLDEINHLDEVIDIANVLVICRAKYSEKLNIHHIHIHKYGHHSELTFHIRLPDELSLHDSHDIVSNLERKLMDETGIEVTIHAEPLSHMPA